MPRMSRIYLSGSLYHIVLRANANESLFQCVDDSQYFMHLLEEGIERFGHTIYAYCFMKDHVHLLIRMHKEPLSRIIHNLTSRYTRNFNRQHQRQGHLFHGRFKAILCDEEDYLYELIRYIHMNPVRQGIASNPDKFLWSSHRTYTGKKELAWLPKQEVLQYFSVYDHLASERFQAFVKQATHHDPSSFEKGIRHSILGSESFIQHTLQQAKAVSEPQLGLSHIITAVCDVLNVSAYDIRRASRQHHLSQARGMIGLIVQEEGRDRLSDVAQHCQRALSSISRSVARVGKEVQENKDLKNSYQRALQKAISYHESDI
ncbi:MAG: transposase [Mariprofundaceae bacterium]|nr:transposase [Mariprofundaceae bacterium]